MQNNEPEEGPTGTNRELRDLDRERDASRRELEKEREKLEEGEIPRPDLRG